MKVLHGLLLVTFAVQSVVPSVAPGAPSTPSALPDETTEGIEPELEPEPIDYEAAMGEVLAATRAADWDRALLATQPLFDAEDQLGEYARAESHFARGLVWYLREDAKPTHAGAYLASVPSFESARALAGSGELRLRANYDRGLALLWTAERWRGLIPEKSQEILQATGIPPIPAPPTPPVPDGADAPEPPDPLALARTFYLAAKDAFVERLRADWRDADTRANLELIGRRLRELDEIEQQREEQQQEQQQDQEQESEDQEQQDGEPSDEESSDENQDQENDGEPEDSESEGNPEDQESDEEQEPSLDERPENSAESEPEGEAGEAQQGDPSDERLLTREQVMRLLDKLEQLDGEREALEARIQRAQRIPVDRDW